MAKSPQFDTATYEEAKTYLKAAFEHSVAVGRDVWELTEFAFEKFGDAVAPYLRQFFTDVHEDRIKIQGLAESAKMAVLRPNVTAEEREAMIREAAYLRAERRGFVGGSPDDDWLLAEREVDEQLVKESGFLGKGRQAMSSATTSAEQELESLKDVISRWLEGNSGLAATSETKTSPRKKIVTRKSAPAKKKVAPINRTAGKGKVVVKNNAATKKSAPVQKEVAPAKKKTETRKSASTKKKVAPSKKPAGMTKAAAKKKTGTRKSASTKKKVAPAKKTAGNGRRTDRTNSKKTSRKHAKGR